MDLMELGGHFSGLYREKNNLFLRDLGDRIAYLYLSFCDLQETIRKAFASELVEITLARVISGIFCIVEFFPGLSLGEQMSRKYPYDRCVYCGNFPCACEIMKRTYQLAEINFQQASWSLKKWQEHLRSVYKWQNQNRIGIDGILGKLSGEIAQLLMLQKLWWKTSRFGISAETLGDFLSLEICDTLAWTIAVANFCGTISLEKVVSQYFRFCPECGKNPCKCSCFWMDPIDWDLFFKKRKGFVIRR